ncbi:MAG: 3-phosphoshikimate 1-carboxyvinyltransferase, partial [Actinomycetota bacterium]|nr:3-phosphoshikimate 1-carboxyvinyltransferase [Actinomycetota bacterium]
MHLSRSTFPDVVSIKRTLTRPEVVVRPPGSKSLTNRALLCASLATGRSEL